MRLANQCAYTAQRRTHRSVQHQTAEEGAEVLQLRGSRFPAGTWFRRPVIHRIKPAGDSNQHRGHCQGIEKCREKSRHQTKQQAQQPLAANAKQQACEYRQQQILHEENTRHHEHEQQDNRQVARHLPVHGCGSGHTDQDGFQGK